METINIGILFQHTFPMPNKHRGHTVKVHQQFCHVPYSLKTARDLIVTFKSLFTSYVQNIKVLGQIIFHIKLKQFYLNVSQHQTAAFRSVYVHCCRHFTHQVDICIHFMHTVLNSARCAVQLEINQRCQEGNDSDITNIVPHKARKKLRIAGFQTENRIHYKENANVGVSTRGKCVNMLRPDMNATSKKGIISIPSLDIQTILLTSSYFSTFLFLSTKSIGRDEFPFSLLFMNFSKSVQKIQFVLKYDNNFCNLT